MRAGTGYDELIAALDHGPAGKIKTLVIPEGYRLTQIEARFRASDPAEGIRQGGAAAVPPPGFGHHVNMEGFMFPATYTIRPNETGPSWCRSSCRRSRTPGRR